MVSKDDRGGFSVSTDPGTNIVGVRAWGFWSTETAAAFDVAVIAECATRPRSTVVVDARDLTAQRDEAQAAFARLFEALRAKGAQVEVLTASPLTKLQLTRIVRERGLVGTVQLK